MSFRSKFATSDETYLLSHSIGLAPKTLRAHLDESCFSPWERDPASAWPAWLSVLEGYRERLAALFSDSAANFCPQANVSSAVTKVLYALPELRDRPQILLSEDAFPSLGFVFERAARYGFEAKFLPAGAGAEDPDVWRQHLSPRVGVVLVTHVHSNTGVQLPVGDIARVAREQGAVTVVDTAQSNGLLPIVPADWNADFVVGSCVKWLCGGPGAGFLWVNPAIVGRTRPVDVGWFSHADPFEFDIHEFRYASDALRFWGGTPSVLPFAAAAHAIDLINDIGVDAVREHNLRLTDRLLEGVDSSMRVSPREPERRSGTVVLDLGKRHEALTRRLKEAAVRFDERARGIRLSPHIYNTEDDIDLAVDCLS